METSIFILLSDLANSGQQVQQLLNIKGNSQMSTVTALLLTLGSG